jgi:hypothetical protein
MTELTEHQKELKRKHLCVICGQPAVQQHHWLDECADCMKMGKPRGGGMYSLQGMSNEFARRLGVHARGIPQDVPDDGYGEEDEP